MVVVACGGDDDEPEATATNGSGGEPTSSDAMSSPTGATAASDSPTTTAVSPTSAVTTAASDLTGSISVAVFGDPAEKAAYEGLVSAFEQMHPEIDVELIHIPSQGDYRKRLGTDFASGAPADIVLINYRRR